VKECGQRECLSAAVAAAAALCVLAAPRLDGRCTAIDWGRYGELFDYNANTGQLTAEPLGSPTG
jgi:hypothetical protein